VLSFEEVEPAHLTFSPAISVSKRFAHVALWPHTLNLEGLARPEQHPKKYSYQCPA